MTAATLNRTAHSAYPPAVQELMPQALELTRSIGAVPSRNRLMKDFKIGAPKAIAVREALIELADNDAAMNDTAMVDDGQFAGPGAVELAPVSAPPAAEYPAVAAAAEPVPAPVAPHPAAAVEPVIETVAQPPVAAEPVPAEAVAQPPVVAPAAGAVRRRPVTWPVLILCLPAFVAIWAGWVEMGRLTGFGKVTLLPGITDFRIDTAITLPIGVETYAAYALWVWLSGRVTGDAREFAKWSAVASLGLGALGQVAYHLMAAADWSAAPWPITAAVACIPVAVLGMGAALAHLMHQNR